MNPRIVILIAAAIGGVGFFAGRYSAPTASSLPPVVPIDTEVKVIRVGDGDTIEVSPLNHEDRKEKVRLLGLNAPGKGEKLYAEASKALASLVDGKVITLEFEADGVTDRDEHNRVLAYVFVDDQNVNVEMVRLGWSEFSNKHGGGRFAAELNAAEAQAKDARAGVWRLK